MTDATAAVRPRVRLGRRLLLLVGLFGLLALGVLIAALAFAWPNSALPSGQFEVSARAVPAAGDDPYFVPEGRFYLINLAPGAGAHQGFGEPSRDGGLIALSAVNERANLAPDAAGSDNFARCDLPWRADFLFEGSEGWFRDPCFGSTFTIAGIRVFGPSPRSMDTLAVIVRSDGSVVVDTSDVSPGAQDNALRAVPYPAN